MKTDKETKYSAIKFPCDFPIKVMGRADADFDLLAVNIVRKYVPDVLEGAVKSRLSRNQNYIAVTITVEAQSQEQLDNIYQELTAHDRVIMAL
jgi:putative lipoic acid-binding regulatory protein